jgi:hypothetical protein
MAGVQMTGPAFQQYVGQALADFNRSFERLSDIRYNLAWMTAADVATAYGISEADATVIKSAIEDVGGTLYGVYTGGQAQVTPNDFRAWAKRLWGPGTI